MTQKETYKQVEEFAKAQGWELVPDQITGKKYALCVMNAGGCIKKY